MEEVEDKNKRKDIKSSWIGRQYVKMFTLPKAIYRFHIIPITISVC